MMPSTDMPVLDGEGKPLPDLEALRRAVDQALLDMAFGRLRQSVVLTLIVCVVFVALFWSFFPSDSKIIWIAALLTVSVLRYALWQVYQNKPQGAVSHRHWQRLFLAGAVAAGLSWAYGPVMMMPAAGQIESMLLVLAAMAVSAVSMSAMGAQVVAMMSFQCAVLAPTLLALAATGGSVERMAAAVVFAGMVSLMIVGRASSAATRSLIETKLRLSQSIAETSAARERAEAASHAKSRFLANMSHELRSPLNAVIGAAQLLRAGEREPQRQEQLVDAIQRSGTNLLGLIDNILDLSRIEAGEFQREQQDFHLFDCIDAALATAGLAARAKGLHLACIVDPRLPAWRHGDAAALRQALLNLLGNAVKFTPGGDIVVRVNQAAAPFDVRIAISDTGIGISPNALEHVFEPFRQADDSAVRRFGGSGLGLAIVRQLVESLGGHVSVASNPGQGSVFTLQLALPPAHRGADEPVEPPCRIAYFEPHLPSADALRALLERMGHEVMRCDDLATLRAWCDGIDRNADNAWLLVCIDTPRSQPVLQLARQCLARDRIIGMSGAESLDVALSDNGPALSRSVVKPVLRSALASRLVRPDARSAPDPAPGAAVGTNPLAPSHILVVEDDALNRTIVSRMLEHAGHRVSLAVDGHAALAALRVQAFALVLMDWQMPDMDGLEVTRRIRAGAAGERARQVPIVALTAHAFAEDRAACMAAGMNDFLTKPVLANSLNATIARWTGPGSAAHAAEAPRTPVEIAS